MTVKMSRRNRKKAHLASTQPATIALQEENAQLTSTVELFEERLAELELSLEDDDWQRLNDGADEEFTREGLRRITKLARLHYLKHPLIKRAAEVKRLYVWGQGFSVRAVDPQIDEVVRAFMDDEKNKAELTDHLARSQKEIDRQTDGNLFFVLFTNPQTGRVRVRSIPFNQIEDVICNPQDSKEPWYYKRMWTQKTTDMATGNPKVVQEVAYYPCWQYNPTTRPDTIGGKSIVWDAPIYHVKCGGFSDWKFGVSELYAAIDWSKAYKTFMEDWLAIMRAYRRFAWQINAKGGKRGVAAAKAKLNSTFATGGTSVETNPAPVTGATFVGSDGAKMEPIKTAGATVAPDDGRRVLLMVMAAVGLPETFMGDASVGSLATAKSLDRPTELMMIDIQTLWKTVFGRIIDYAMLQAVKATRGPLNGLGAIPVEDEDGQRVERVEWNEGVDALIDIDFPPLVVEDAKARVDAIVSAATLDSQEQAGTLPFDTLVRMILIALGEDDVDDIMMQMFPDGWEADTEHPANRQSTDDAPTQESTVFLEAVRDLRAQLAEADGGNE